jgi:S-formylglutathione hydrolase FrmB
VRESKIHPDTWEIAFDSGVLQAEKKFCLIVPESVAQAPDGWPVLFFLHGRGRTPRSLVDLEPMRQVFRGAPFCTVFPQGDDGWYIDSPVNPKGRYEAYLEEVIAWAGRVRPLTRTRERRAITGWSMGGYGAVRFAIRHPDDFGVVAGLIGLLDFPRPADLPEGQNYAVPAARFGSDPDVWRQFNPLAEAGALRGRAVLLITAADAFDRTYNERFHARLRELKIPHEFLVLPGAHTFDVVQAAVPRIVNFVARNFSIEINPRSHAPTPIP